MHCVTLNERQVTYFHGNVTSPNTEFRTTRFKYL